MRRLLMSIVRYRSLLLTLTSRELKARYRGSVLGYFWSLVNPILLLLVYAFVFGTIFQPRDASVKPYALFLACGVFPWLWLSTAWIEGSNTLAANSGLIRKAAFPAHLLPLVSVFANLIHFAFALPVIAGGIAYFRWHGETVGGLWGLAAPLVVLIQIPFVSGLALAFSALNVHFKDVRDILTNLLNLLFFMTPILYTLETVKPYRLVHALVAYNPFTPFVTAYHALLFYGRCPGLMGWLLLVVISVVVFALGAGLFERLEDTLVEAV